MTRGFPDWQPFALESGDAAPLELSGMRGSALVILASPGVDESGWGVRAAARIASQRAGRTTRLLLADLDLEHPRLHMELGTDNDEGATDSLLFGASLQRVARPVDAGFLFIPAGTAVADPGEVMASDRWGPILDGFARAGAEIFVYLPAGTPGRDILLARARNAVVLAGPEETEWVRELAVPGLRLGALLGPVEAERPVEEVVDDDDVGRVAGPAEPEPPQPEAPVTTERSGSEAIGTAAGPPAGDGAGSGAPRPRAPLARDREPEEFDQLFHQASEADFRRVDGTTEPPTRGGAFAMLVPRLYVANRPGRRALLVAAVLVLLLALVAAAGLTGLVRIPGLPVLSAFQGASSSALFGDTPSLGAEEPAPGGEAGPVVGEAGPAAAVTAPTATGAGSGASGAAPAAAGDDSAVGPTGSWSLAVASYQELAPALERVATLRGRAGDLLVVVAPVRVEAREWHRVLVGPIPDTAGAADLRRSLAGSGEAGSDWFVRSTPLALALDTPTSLEAARARVAELAALRIPAYALELPPSGGGSRFRIYVGAYADEAEAAHARSLLAARGVVDVELVARVGRIPLTPRSPSE